MRNEQKHDDAGFFIRIFALLIDLLILSLLLSLFGTSLNNEPGNIGISLDASGSIIVALYYFITDWLLKGSIGKKALRLAVFDEYGDRLSPSRSLLRILSRLLTFLTLFLGYLTIVFREDKRALHDIMSNTYVFKI